MDAESLGNSRSVHFNPQASLLKSPMKTHPTRIGLFGIGLEAYWPQFPELKERLEGFIGEVERRLGRPGIEVVNLGLIDTPEKALDAGH